VTLTSTQLLSPILLDRKPHALQFTCITQDWITTSVELAILASYMTSVAFTFPQPHHLTTGSTYVWRPHEISNQCDVGPDSINRLKFLFK
jgi:hypothetical protein